MPLVLKSVDCHVIENSTRHITTQYEQTRAVSSSHQTLSPAHQSQSSAQPKYSGVPVSDSEVSPHRDSSHQPQSSAHDSAQQKLSDVGVSDASSQVSFHEPPESTRRSSQHPRSSAQDSAQQSRDSANESITQYPPSDAGHSAVSSSHKASTATVQEGADRFSQQSIRQELAHLVSTFQPSAGPQLVVRRGLKFTIQLEFDRPYDKQKDDIIFAFQFGQIYLPYHVIFLCSLAAGGNCTPSPPLQWVGIQFATHHDICQLPAFKNIGLYLWRRNEQKCMGMEDE